MQSKKVSPARPSNFDIDDYIGMESCVDLRENHTATDMSPPQSFLESRKMWGIGRRIGQREYPPPIPLLVRTENPSSLMPWVLKRRYTGDGRLILTEERVRHHEFFLAHRSDGRLVLHLVAFDESNVEMGDDEDGGEDECTAEEGGVGGGECGRQRPSVYVGGPCREPEDHRSNLREDVSVTVTAL